MRKEKQINKTKLLISVFILIIAGYTSACAEKEDPVSVTEAVITGKLGSRQSPCPPRPGTSCPSIDVRAIVSNTVVFVPVKNGRIDKAITLLEDYSRGDIITIRGKYSKGECRYGEFYFLEIIEIIETID